MSNKPLTPPPTIEMYRRMHASLQHSLAAGPAPEASPQKAGRKKTLVQLEQAVEEAEARMMEDLHTLGVAVRAYHRRARKVGKPPRKNGRNKRTHGRKLGKR
jgi:hypothetical protein